MKIFKNNTIVNFVFWKVLYRLWQALKLDPENGEILRPWRTFLPSFSGLAFSFSGQTITERKSWWEFYLFVTFPYSLIPIIFISVKYYSYQISITHNARAMKRIRSPISQSPISRKRVEQIVIRFDFQKVEMSVENFCQLHSFTPKIDLENRVPKKSGWFSKFLESDDRFSFILTALLGVINGPHSDKKCMPFAFTVLDISQNLRQWG